MTGGDIRYEYTGSGYKIELTLYQICDPYSASISDSAYVYKKSSCSPTLTGNMVVRYDIDTLYDMYCASSGAGCSGSNNNYRIVHRYSGIIPSLAPCSDWKFYYNNGPRPSNIVNLAYSGSSNLYIEAFLNNSTVPNSSPIFGNDPAFYALGYTNNTNPFQIMDIDGDSIVAETYQPQFAENSFIPYASGYSLASPIAGYMRIDQPSATIMTMGSWNGRFATAVRLKEYRNGVLVGSSSRDWTTEVSAGVAYTSPPLPSPGTSFITSSCPGATTTLNFSFTDSIATDTVIITPKYPSSYNNTTTGGTGVGSASATTTWVTPTSLNPTTTPYTLLNLGVRNTHCPNTGYTNYKVLVRNMSCYADNVWPGDVNGDKIADLYDPLFLALANGETGPARTNPTTTWTPQLCMFWSTNFANGMNKKHADCDGNGIINNADLAAVNANYGRTHPKGTENTRARGAGLPELYFDGSIDYTHPGDTMSIPIMLGNNTTPMSNILGLSTRIIFDNIAPENMSITYPTSWLGTSSNTLRFQTSVNPNALEWSYARIDKQNISGQGQIAMLKFKVPITTPVGTKIGIKMADVKMINAFGQELTSYNVINDTLVTHPVGVANTANRTFSVSLVPNPSFGDANLSLSILKGSDLDITITDATGRIVWHKTRYTGSGTHFIQLPTELQSGIYIVRIADNAAVQTIKWSKAN